MTDYEAFVRESNRIEGIFRDPTDAEVRELERFIALPSVSRREICAFVGVYQPDAVLRDKRGLDVRVGNHIAPSGGSEIVKRLVDVLARANIDEAHPYLLHQEYETLHPFTDGNGRSGRALWAWQMSRFGYRPGLQLGFLHAWYYQSLEHCDARKS